MFFVQNAGAKAAGTGLAKSAIIQKISLSAVTPAVASQRDARGSVKVEVVDSNPMVVNPNGEFHFMQTEPGTRLTGGNRGN
jgi:gluconolactonase